MNKNEILNIRKEITEFFKSDELIYEFEVKSELKERNSLPYKIIFPGARLILFYFRHLAARVAQFIDYSPVKKIIYRSLGIKIGKGAFIAPDVVIDAHFPRLIEIGDYAILGWGSKIFVHDFDGKIFRIGRVIIGRGAVIGGYSFVRAGVKIGDEALVKLTSTAYKDIPDHGRNDPEHRTLIKNKRG